jgi:hypothetical protein
MASKQLLGVVTSLTLLSTVACGDAKESGIDDSNGSGGSGGSAQGGSLVLVPVAGSSTGLGGAGTARRPGTLPDGFTKVDTGGYQLGELPRRHQPGVRRLRHDRARRAQVIEAAPRGAIRSSWGARRWASPRACL